MGTIMGNGVTIRGGSRANKGVQLNIDYGSTPPSDTSKLWCSGITPINIQITPNVDLSNNTIKQFKYTLNSTGFSNTPTSYQIISIADNDDGVFCYVYYQYSKNNTTYSGVNICKLNTDTGELTFYVAISDNGSSLTTYGIPYSWGVSLVGVGHKLYSFGGINGYSQASFRSYIKIDGTNTDSPTLTKVDNSTFLSSSALMGCCRNGTDIYLVGGYEGSDYNYTNGNINKFDTTTDTFTRIKYDTSTYRYCGQAICIKDNRYLYMFGGTTGYRQDYNYSVNSVRMYDLTSNSISVVATIPESVAFGKVYVMGDYIYYFKSMTNFYDMGGAGINTCDYCYKFNTTNNTFEKLTLTIPYICDYENSMNVRNGVMLLHGVRSTGFYSSFTINPPLEYNHLLIKSNSSTNMWKAINNSDTQLELGIDAVYIGDENGLAQPQEAKLYNDSSETWVTI